MKKFLIFIIISISTFTTTSSQSWEIFTTENSNLPVNFINNLLFDAEDNLWINGYSSVFMFDNKMQEWITYNKTNSIIGEKINSLYRDNYNNIWAAGEAIYIFERQNKKWEISDSSTNANYLAVDDSGKMYIVKDMSIFYKSKNKWELIFDGTKDGSIISPSKLLIDNNNTLWFGFYSNSFDFFSYKNDILINHTKTENNLPSIETTDLCLDSSNNIWVSSGEHAKTYKFDSSLETWFRFDSTNSFLGKDYLYSKGISTSEYGKVWLAPGKLFSFPPRFLTCFYNGNWKKFSIDEGLNLSDKEELSLLALAVDSKNNVWIGTNKGLIKFNEITTNIETKDESDISIYPNPTSTKLTIDLQGKQVTSYTISDIKGNIIENKHDNYSGLMNINLKSYPIGTFIIELTLTNNQKITNKFVKE